MKRRILSLLCCFCLLLPVLSACTSPSPTAAQTEPTDNGNSEDIMTGVPTALDTAQTQINSESSAAASDAETVTETAEAPDKSETVTETAEPSAPAEEAESNEATAQSTEPSVAPTEPSVAPTEPTTATTEPTKDETEEPTVSKTYQVLFIGNSYTYYNDMPTVIFKNIAASAGYQVNVTAITKGAHTLLQFADKTDDYGKKVEAALTGTTRYDFVILQEQSVRPATSKATDFYAAVRDLCERIRETGATPILYSTWGRKTGSETLTTYGFTNESMTYRLAAAYQAIADELSLEVSHVGLAFYDVYTSDHAIELYNADKSHPSYAGSYLAAATLFASVFDQDLTDITYFGSLSQSNARILLSAAQAAAFAPPAIPDEYKTSTDEPKDEPTDTPTDTPTEPTDTPTDTPTEPSVTPTEPTTAPTDTPCTHEEGSFVQDGDKYHVYRYACGCEDAPNVRERHTDSNADDICDVCQGNLKQEAVSLDGKKIIFIGDSFVYYGCTVLERAQTTLTRNHKDYGFFYQLCKANGENVTVTNFTFGGHGLNAFVTDSCPTSYGCAGEDHMSYLTDRNYDYVVLSGGRNSQNTAATLYKQVQYLMALFREANPNVKFVYLVSSGAHNVSVSQTFPHDVLNGLDELEDMGVTVVDWGALVADIISGETTVPGATQTYNKNTFIVSKSSSDGYHPNQLSGYITTLMTYAALTGKSAVGQPYSFVGDSSLTSDSNYRSFEKYIAAYYKNGAETNYPAVFASASDMRGIQSLIDLYLKEKKFRDYDFEPLGSAKSASLLPEALLPTEIAERKERV